MKKDSLSAKGGSTNAVVESDSESEGVFAIESNVESVLSNSEIPELESVASDSSGSFDLDNPDFEEGDWFSEIGDDKLDSSGSWNCEIEDNSPLVDRLDIPEPALVAIKPTNPSQSSYIRTEVYDSGCTKHISPYRDDLHNFTEIPPKSF